MGSIFREVLQEQLDLLSKVVNHQHELDLERVKIEGSTYGFTYRSENSCEVDAGQGNSLKLRNEIHRMQKSCDVELESIHMLRDGQRNDDVGLVDVVHVQSFEKHIDDNNDIKVQNVGSPMSDETQAPGRPSTERLLLTDASSTPVRPRLSNSSNKSSAPPEDPSKRMKQDLIANQVELAELRAELQDAREELQEARNAGDLTFRCAPVGGSSTGAVPFNARKKSIFGMPASGNRRAKAMSVLSNFTTGPDSSLSAWDSSLSSWDDEEGVMPGKSGRLTQKSLAVDSRASIMSITSRSASPCSPPSSIPFSQGKRAERLTTKKNKAAVGSQISKPRMGNSRSRKVAAGLSVMPEGSESNLTSLSDEMTLDYDEDEPPATAWHIDEEGCQTTASLESIQTVQKKKSLEALPEFDLLPEWEEVLHCKSARGNGIAVDGMMNQRMSELSIGQRASLNRRKTETVFMEPGWMNRFVFHPKSRSRLTWDVLGIMFTTYDAFVIPLAFLDLTENTFTISMSWITRLFWTLDIFWACLTGYSLDNGDLEMRVNYIVWRYLRTWFLFDVCLVFADWMQELLTEGLSTAGRMGRGGKIARITRILRLVRLLRAARLKYIVASWFENMAVSEQVSIISGITMASFAILCCMHLIACVWYGIGVSSPENWAIAQKIREEAFWSRYCHSLFWATGQFTGGVDPEPLNDQERVFIVFVMILSFLLATCFVSSFTSSLTQLQILSSHRAAKFQMLKRYMSQNHISHKLSIRVNRNARHMYSELQRKTPEEDVELLKILSEPLRVEMHFEMYFPTLAKHPLFLRYCEEMIQSMRKVCHHSLCTISLSAGDILFSTGEEPAQRDMLFVTEGQFHYLHPIVVDYQHEPSPVKPCLSTASQLTLQETIVVAGDWVSEPVMWTRGWLYCGTLRATYDSQVLVLEGDVFMQLALKTRNLQFDLGEYAKEYVAALKELGSKVSDLGTVVDEGEIVLKCYGPRMPKCTASALPRMQSRTQRSVIKQIMGGESTARTDKSTVAE